MKLVILDRDGVINFESKKYIKSPEEWTPIPGSLEAIAELNRAGFTVVVATNQSGIGRGLFDLAMLEKTHQKLCSALEKVNGHVEKIFFCPHKPEDQCDCRKPAAGLFIQIKEYFRVSLADVPMIGDSYRDILAAKLVKGCPMLVLTGNGQETLETHPELNKEILIFQDLREAASWLIKKKG